MDPDSVYCHVLVFPVPSSIADMQAIVDNNRRKDKDRILANQAFKQAVSILTTRVNISLGKHSNLIWRQLVEKHVY